MTKDELREYRYIRLELEQCDRESARLYSIAERCVKCPSSVPGFGRDRDPYPDIMDKLSDVQAQASALFCDLLVQRQRIETALGELSGRERCLMRARYIDGLGWKKIADMLGYSIDHTWKVHGCILKKMTDNNSF